MEETFIRAAIVSPNWFCTLKEDSLWTFINEFASPAIALISLCFAIYIHIKTQNLVIHVERPILGLDKSKVHTIQGQFQDGATVDNQWHMVFKNKGKHPAINFKMTMICVSLHQNKTFPLSFESPNRVDPDDYYTQSGNIFSIGPITNLQPVLIKLVIEYTDLVQVGKKYQEEHWYKFSGRETIDHATMAEKEQIESAISNDIKV